MMDGFKVGAAILCGGKSSRMGCDKASLTIGRVTFRQIIENILSEFPEIIIASPEYDVFPGQGPMAGIHASLLRSSSNALFFVPCDMPLITADFAREISSVMHGGIDAAVPEFPGGFLFPPCAVYSKSCIEVFERHLLENKNALYKTFPELNVKRFPVSDTTIFANINTKEDYECIKSKSNIITSNLERL